MTEREVSGDSESSALYEIRLEGTSAEPLRREFPTATVSTTRTETVLVRQVEKPAELNELIDHLLSRGFVLTEVHQLEPPSTSAVEPQDPTSEEGLSDGDDV
jgi:hypothetical protein